MWQWYHLHVTYAKPAVGVPPCCRVAKLLALYRWSPFYFWVLFLYTSLPTPGWRQLCPWNFNADQRELIVPPWKGPLQQFYEVTFTQRCPRRSSPSQSCSASIKKWPLSLRTAKAATHGLDMAGEDKVGFYKRAGLLSVQGFPFVL